jgi:hypothetical protein
MFLNSFPSLSFFKRLVALMGRRPDRACAMCMFEAPIFRNSSQKAASTSSKFTVLLYHEEEEG